MHQFQFSHMGNKITLAQGYFWWKLMDMVCDLPHIMKEKSTKKTKTNYTSNKPAKTLARGNLFLSFHCCVFLQQYLWEHFVIVLYQWLQEVVLGICFTSIFVGRSFGSSSCSTNIDHICSFDQDYRATSTNYAFFVRPRCWVLIYLAVVAHHS